MHKSLSAYALWGAAFVLGFGPPRADATNYGVSNTLDSGIGSLRQAIMNANAHLNDPGQVDEIRFFLSAASAKKIVPLSELPAIDDPVIITGALQSGYSGVPLVEINGASAGGSATGLKITAGDSVVRAICVTGFGGRAIQLRDNDGNKVEGCYIGLTAAGAAAGNPGEGIEIRDSSDNTIGGTASIARNVISSNLQSGIRIRGSSSKDNLILGNYIGTNVNGSAALGNTIGISVVSSASRTTIGGATTSARNLISGNTQTGVALLSSAQLNTLTGNFIGLNASGTSAIPNGVGIDLTATTLNTIGGLTSEAANFVSGNTTAGIRLISITGQAGSTPPSNNSIRGNVIGLSLDGNDAVGNGIGILLQDGGTGNVIGGDVAGAGNVIAGNSTGIRLVGLATSANQIAGNTIGTNLLGFTSLGNTGYGIEIGGPGGAGSAANMIGGTSSLSRNVISRNGGGILLSGADATGNQVLGNYIGTSLSGDAALGNAGDGIRLECGAASNQIGGGAPGSGNVISGNAQNGIRIEPGACGSPAGNVIRGNIIGADASGGLALGNGAAGISAGLLTSGNTIGGTGAGESNLISANGAGGITLESFTSGVLILGNRIGTDLTGTLPFPNAMYGVRLQQSALNHISWNSIRGGPAGILLVSSAFDYNTLEGNTITGATNGILLAGSGANTIVSNTLEGNTTSAIELTGNATLANNISMNTIRNNGAGVRILESFSNDNRISRNSIHSNTGLGIDLGVSHVAGVSPNDGGDNDDGGNRLQNYPVLTFAEADPGILHVTGTLDSLANYSFTLEFFSNSAADGSGFGEGERFIGSIPISTNGAGHTNFGQFFYFPSLRGTWLSATATDSFGNTSEFSQSLQIALRNLADSGWMLYE